MLNLYELRIYWGLIMQKCLITSAVILSVLALTACKSNEIGGQVVNRTDESIQRSYVSNEVFNASFVETVAKQDEGNYVLDKNQIPEGDSNIVTVTYKLENPNKDISCKFSFDFSKEPAKIAVAQNNPGNIKCGIDDFTNLVIGPVKN